MSRYEVNMQSLKVGQEVVVFRSGSWDVQKTFGYKVTNVTPTGRVTVQRVTNPGTPNEHIHQLKFNKENRLMGDAYDAGRYWIDDRVAERREEDERQRRILEAIKALEAVNVGEDLSRRFRYVNKAELQNHIFALEEKFTAAKIALAAV